MISRTIEELIANPGESSLNLLFEDEASIFWVDWREEDDAVVEYCEAVLKTGDLNVKYEGEFLYIRYKGQRSKVPLTETAGDRHITIFALCQAFREDFGIRMAWASSGSDTLAFAPLSTGEWADLEQRYGQEAVDFAFFKIAESPNVFTDSLHKHQPRKRKWWQVWG